MERPSQTSVGGHCDCDCDSVGSFIRSESKPPRFSSTLIPRNVPDANLVDLIAKQTLKLPRRVKGRLIFLLSTRGRAPDLCTPDPYFHISNHRYAGEPALHDFKRNET